MSRAGFLGLLLIWLYICVKNGYGRLPVGSSHKSVMVVDDDVPSAEADNHKDTMHCTKDSEKDAP